MVRSTPSLFGRGTNPGRSASQHGPVEDLLAPAQGTPDR